MPEQIGFQSSAEALHMQSLYFSTVGSLTGNKNELLKYCIFGNNCVCESHKDRYRVVCSDVTASEQFSTESLSALVNPLGLWEYILYRSQKHVSLHIRFYYWNFSFQKRMATKGF